MNYELAHTLSSVTSEFYRANADSFSATRNAPWLGWKKCAELLCALMSDAADVPVKVSADADVERVVKPGSARLCAKVFGNTKEDGYGSESTHLCVLDVACGNLRFESYLREQFPQVRFHFCAVDNCRDLVAYIPDDVLFVETDVMEHLLVGIDGVPDGEAALNTENACVAFESVIPGVSTIPSGSDTLIELFDATVSFGFMHHIPSQALRLQFLRRLIKRTRPGGLVMVSFWQFMNNEKLAQKAHETHQRALDVLNLPARLVAEFESGDYLLGWKDTQLFFRYCHHFSEEELDSIVEALASEASLVSRFTADGRTNNLNTYLIFRCAV